MTDHYWRFWGGLDIMGDLSAEDPRPTGSDGVGPARLISRHGQDS